MGISKDLVDDMMNYSNITNSPANEIFNVAERLPELNDDQIKHAHAPDQINWAYRHFSLGVGYVWNIPEVGIGMQVTSTKTMRVLNVVNHDFPMLILACIRRTLEHLGMDLEMDTAVVMPYKETGNRAWNEEKTDVNEDSLIEVV